MTVYEFDDSKVGEQGVTVKCTQCGNLFKVKRRETTAEMPIANAAARSPAYVPPTANTNRATVQGHPVLGRTPTPARGTATSNTPTPTPTKTPAVDVGWMVRVRSNGETYKFKELTTLQQWIVERKVTRDDEISRTGEQWKRLGGIAELASFFHVVEQAAAVARADGPRAAAEAASAAYQRRSEEDPALVTTAPMTREAPRERSGPIAMGNPVPVEDPAFARTNPTPKATPASVPSVHDDELDDDFEVPRRRRAGMWAGIVAALVLVGGGGYLAMFKREALRSLFAGKPDSRVDEAYRQGREYFLLDSDDAFRNAAAAFERAQKADEKSALPVAGLAEVKSTWAQYLKDDAKALESGSGNGPTMSAATAAKTLRREAQADLDEAKRLAGDALNLDPEAPEVNRAMADYLRVDGAPPAEVDRYLTRATTRRPADAESAFVGGAVAFRDGKLEEAKAKLQQANQLNMAATQHPLVRATYMLARIEMLQGDRAGAKRDLQAVLGANAQHDRARALLATIEAEEKMVMGPQAAPTTTAAAPSGVAATAAAPTPTPTKTPTAEAGAGATAATGDKTEDYSRLVTLADRLSENGHAKEARKLYERALQQRPNGLEAIMGLGYCDLDGEKFSAAVDRFKRALEIQPSYGDAIIGLAEAYKLRGDRHEALNWYKQYLSAQPNGPKAAMAKNNIRDLEPKAVPTTEVKEVPPTTETRSPDEPKPAPPETKNDDKPTPLPRPPAASDETSK